MQGAGYIAQAGWSKLEHGASCSADLQGGYHRRVLGWQTLLLTYTCKTAKEAIWKIAADGWASWGIMQ